MSVKVEYYQDSQGEWRWRATSAANGQNVGSASEGFSSEAAARTNWERDRSRDTVEYYQDKAGDWRWRAVAVNGQVTGAANEGFSSKQTAEHNAELNGYGACEVKAA